MLLTFLKMHRVEVLGQAKAHVSSGSAHESADSSAISPLFDELIETLETEKFTAEGAERTAVLPAPTSSARSARDVLATQRSAITSYQAVSACAGLRKAVMDLAYREANAPDVATHATLERFFDQSVARAISRSSASSYSARIVDDAHLPTERVNFFAVELRRQLEVSFLAAAALQCGSSDGWTATASELAKSLAGLRKLMNKTLADLQLSMDVSRGKERICLEDFMREAEPPARMDAHVCNCKFTVFVVDPRLYVDADRAMLSAALANLLDNAFAYTKPGGHVRVKISGTGYRVQIQVLDESGGLPREQAERMFRPLSERKVSRAQWTSGLTIARRCVEASGGTLTVHDVPGYGCVFNIDLPQTHL